MKKEILLKTLAAILDNKQREMLIRKDAFILIVKQLLEFIILNENVQSVLNTDVEICDTFKKFAKIFDLMIIKDLPYKKAVALADVEWEPIKGDTEDLIQDVLKEMTNEDGEPTREKNDD